MSDETTTWDHALWIQDGAPLDDRMNPVQPGTKKAIRVGDERHPLTLRDEE